MLKHVFILTITLLLQVNTCCAHVDSAKLTEECKIADICRHDQVPICGLDSCGEMRTFIDTCDMHEFNCDSKKEPLVTVYLTPTLRPHATTGAVEYCQFNGTFNYFVQKPTHECWVTCKRGRSFKKPAYNGDCDIDNLIKT